MAVQEQAMGKKPLWTTARLAERMGQKTKALEIARYRGVLQIPYIRLSPRSIRYDPDVVEEWLRQHTEIPQAKMASKDARDGRARKRPRLRS